MAKKYDEDPDPEVPQRKSKRKFTYYNPNEAAENARIKEMSANRQKERDKIILKKCKKLILNKYSDYLIIGEQLERLNKFKREMEEIIRNH